MASKIRTIGRIKDLHMMAICFHDVATPACQPAFRFSLCKCYSDTLLSIDLLGRAFDWTCDPVPIEPTVPFAEMMIQSLQKNARQVT